RQSASCPLILHVDGVKASAVALPERRVAQRELNRRPVVEDVAQLTARVLEVLLHLKGSLISDLQAVRAGDVGRRGPPDVVKLLVRTGRGPPAIREVAHAR